MKCAVVGCEAEALVEAVLKVEGDRAYRTDLCPKHAAFVDAGGKSWWFAHDEKWVD